MKLPAQRRSHGLKFNITPLIDVVFLLIIFFLVASHFARSDTSQPIDLPRAAEAEDEQPDEQLDRLVVSVTADGKYHVGGREVDMDVVSGLIRSRHEKNADNFEVRVRADQALSFGKVEPIMIAAAKAGVVDVKFGVIEK